MFFSYAEPRFKSVCGRRNWQGVIKGMNKAQGLGQTEQGDTLPRRQQACLGKEGNQSEGLEGEGGREGGAELEQSIRHICMKIPQ